MGIDMEVRQPHDWTSETAYINPDLIQSGDVLLISRLDGLDQMIGFGVGSHIGHTTMALRFDGELYIVEIQNAWYWPTHNAQRTRFDQWIKYADKAQYNVVHCPLSPSKRSQFNETAAQEEFFKLQGLEYGYNVFLFNFWDTPDDNWPVQLPQGFVPILFSIIESYVDKRISDAIFSTAINVRLGTSNLTIPALSDLAAKRGLNLSEVAALPELDTYLYNGKPSMICSGLVARLWKAAGMFEFPVNANEFTPFNIYEVNFFDREWMPPEHCRRADPNQPFCQLIGKYRITLPQYSSVDPYAHMFEKCSGRAPDYHHDLGC